MKELRDILTIWKRLLKQQQTAALATLVKVEGSTYRTLGARMLITSDGQQVGTISGGCLENDVRERSQQVLETGTSILVKYDTTSEEDLIWGLGLGCQGIAYILIERLEPDTSVLSFVAKSITSRQKGAVATVFKVEGTDTVNQCDRLIIEPDGNVISTIANSELEDNLRCDLQSVLRLQQSKVEVYALSEGIVEVFLEIIQPPLSLVIFGAGFDVIPVVNFAKQLGWYVTVIDPLARSHTTKRFEDCDCVILDFSDETTKAQLFDPQTVVVIMSHNYLYDLKFLQILTKICLKYLGILGPKKRTNRLLQELQTEGYIFQPEELYSPVGLDIGADNPEAIALSIIAEIQAVTQNRHGGFLKNRSAPIHSDKSGYFK